MTETKAMTTKDFETKMAELVRKQRAYNNFENEGGEGFNPFDELIQKLGDEWAAFDRSKVQSILSGASLQAERAWFNAQKFNPSNPLEAHKACLKRGYALSELFAAAKAAKRA